jgi:hypothetical protein
MIAARRQLYEEGPDLEAALAYALQKRQVLSLADLMDYVGADGETVRRHLSGRVEGGEAVELRPVTAQQDERNVFYRWRTPGEDAFRRQQGFFEGARPRAGLWWYDGHRIKENEHVHS